MKNQIKITNLDSIVSAENTLYLYKGLEINVYRVKNDINGNPLYRISIFKDGENITENYRGRLGRWNKKKFITIQSYNLSNSIEHMLNYYKSTDKNVLNFRVNTRIR